MKKKIKIQERKALLNRSWMPHPRTLKAKLVLAGLVAICLTSLVLLALPYLPHVNFLFRKPKIDATPYRQAIQKQKTDPTSKAKPEPAKEVGNRLVLPSIGVNAQIIEGTNIYVIGKNQGVWRETRNSNPSQPGNMVIAGHRFLYTATNGGYFYNLPELKIGDSLYIKWSDTVYEYQVYNTRTVLPTQTDIRDNDPNTPYKLTMYTCYPLGSTAKRFVIEAKQVR